MRRDSSPVLPVLQAALDARDAPAADSTCLVAVSGGPDSVALLAGLVALAPARGVGLVAAHLDHGLRGGEGLRERDLVAALCARLAVPLETAALALEWGAGLEARARQARYAALETIADHRGATTIATAHTRDDQAETVLLRLMRGAGRRGLGAMAVRRGRLWRPLLRVARADVRRFVAEHALPFAVDRTNADLAHARNRVRRLVLPLLAHEFNPRIATRLALLAGQLRDEDRFLAQVAATRARSHLRGDALALSVGGEHPAIARRIVRRWLERTGEQAVGSAAVARVLALAAKQGAPAVVLPGGVRVARAGDRLVLGPARGATPMSPLTPVVVAPGAEVAAPDGSWRLGLSLPRVRDAGDPGACDATQAIFDAGALAAPLVVRGPRPGDRIRVPGLGTRKVQDVLVDAKIPRGRRPVTPLIVAGDEILWIAGVLRGAGARVEPTTRLVIDGQLHPGAERP